MKELTKKQKIGAIILALIIIVGITIILTLGLNFDLRFQEAKKVELYLEKEFEVEDIKNITNEVIPNEPVIIQKVEVYEDSVCIIAKEITEEQKQNLVTKINEKYGTEITPEDTQITSIPKTRGRDLVKPYRIPFVIATVIILGYMAIRYRKLGIVKTILKTIAILVIVQAVLLSLIAITRIPVGRLTMPMVVTVYLLTLIGITTRWEKQRKDKKEKEEK